MIDGVLRTAGKDVLEGITRHIVLQEAVAVLPIEYQPVKLAELNRVAEAFITSSSREVMPVVQIDQHLVDAGQPGSITQMLLEKYRAYLALNAETP